MRTLTKRQIKAIRRDETLREVRRAPISLAGSKKPKQVFRGKERDHIVNKAMNILRDWRQSPFEFEGSVHAGLRSALCLDGHGWHQSDHEAAQIVAQGLRMLGAERPTWNQGQRYCTDPRENCRWCYGPIAEEDMSGARNRLFCSDHCSRAAYVGWDMKNAAQGGAMAREAYRAVYRDRFPTRSCEACSKPFKGINTRYCSVRCVTESRRIEVPARACETCGETFRPSSNNLDAKFCDKKCADAAKRIFQPTRCRLCSTTFIPKREGNFFCSSACAHQGKKFREVERVCVYCDTTFLANRADAIYCSRSCTRFAFRVVTGRIKRISMPVFDYLIRCQGIRVTTDAQGDMLTPQKLDWLMMERGLRITSEVRIAA